MENQNIICKATADTFVRFAIVILALVGWGVYFFYDASVGYRLSNEEVLSYQAFSRLGERVNEMDAMQWKEQVADKPLLATTGEGDTLAVERGEDRFLLPQDCEVARSCPAEAADFEAMSAGWAECWRKYSARKHFSDKPDGHPYNEGTIREQWYGGGICILLALVLVYYTVRTARRELALRGDQVTAAGRTFSVADITTIDLRQWGPGFKGCAYFKVKGDKIKVDGMTYGGFKEPDCPAEAFMKALLAQYSGDIISYEQPADEQK